MTPSGRRLQRGVVVLPSAFTLGNLFLGFWAIVSAARGEFETAAWLIVMAGVLDMLDGRVARFMRTNSEFGEQLDSLVDAVSFGVAPAVIIYFLFLGDGDWSWTIAYLYVAAVIIRLARFNVEQAGGAKVAFHGLPSPTAGITLASFYPFTQTAVFERYLTTLPWPQLTTGLVLALSVLMVSHVLYPVVPRFSIRNRRGIVAIIIASVSLIAAFTVPALFFFPATIIYIATGLVRVAVLGFLDRLPERDPLLDEPGDEGEERELEYEEIEARPRLRSTPKHSRKRI
ncbi:MAG TPA: CDP-diacylglycerol--serine O-phosphatidyltransferase [Longimicrobiaceae bacterium]|nr:CDP-diacylglycerol--serine O-phosphatidyltransferase [Longimicrobiaceae bacterium]